MVSIITPTKDRLPLLKAAMASVRRQTFRAWEHIIVDDGSSDGTAAEVEREAARDPRIRLIRREGERGGANVCRNIGVRLSKGAYLLFLDSDDMLAPGCLALRVAALERNQDLDFATFEPQSFDLVPGDRQQNLAWDPAGDHLQRFLHFDVPWTITGPIWRRGSLLRLGLLDESLISWQDYELHVRALCAGARYLRFPEVDHFIRVAADDSRVSRRLYVVPNHLEKAEEVLHKVEALLRAGPGINWTRQRALCGLYFFLSERWIAAGYPAAALRTWQSVRKRRLAKLWLFLSGMALLIGRVARLPVERLTSKWKGAMRLRFEPEVIRA